MSKLYSRLMQEIVQMKISGANKLRIQLLQQKLDKYCDKQTTNKGQTENPDCQ